MGVKENLIQVLKELVLPELDALKGEIAKQGVRLDMVEKRLDDFNSRFQAIDQHLVDQSRRIDGLNDRIDRLQADFIARIDQQNQRIDALTAQVATLSHEVGALRRESEVMADVLRRLTRLEDKVAA